MECCCQRFEELKNEDKLIEAQQKKLEAMRMADARALSKILNGVTAAIFLRIMKATTAKQAWKILKQEF